MKVERPDATSSDQLETDYNGNGRIAAVARGTVAIVSDVVVGNRAVVIAVPELKLLVLIRDRPRLQLCGNSHRGNPDGLRTSLPEACSLGFGDGELFDIPGDFIFVVCVARCSVWLLKP